MLRLLDDIIGMEVSVWTQVRGSLFISRLGISGPMSDTDVFISYTITFSNWLQNQLV